MEIKFKNQVYDIDIENNGSGYILNVNGEKKNINGRKLDDNTFAIYLDNRYVNTYTAEDQDNIYVWIDGKQFTFDKVKEEEKSYGDDGGSSSDREVVLPPMPGSIVKVLVEKGAKVSDGDALIIVEAMKMETTLYSSISGIVKEINVEAGMQVGANDELIIVEKEEE